MKIGILTFHCAANYGAVLQAYALKEVLENLGHEVYLIDYRPKYLITPYAVFSMKAITLKYPKHSIKYILASYIRKKRILHFNQFLKSNFKFCSLDSINDLDAIVAGSDQIWNPQITDGKFDKTYLLDFPLKKDSIKIAYAASAGSSIFFQQDLNNDIIELIKRFDAISVREKSLQTSIQTLIPNINTEVVLDPVLLAGEEIMGNLTDRELAPKTPYILSFSLGYSPETSQIAGQLATEKGIKLVEMVSSSESLTHPELIQTATIHKFLSLIKYAEAVVTTSFHGTALAILFNRPFISCGGDTAHSERSLSLLNILGLEKCYHLIPTGKRPILQNIDYTTVNKILNGYKYMSQTFINQHITPPTKNNEIIDKTYHAAFYSIRAKEGRKAA